MHFWPSWLEQFCFLGSVSQPCDFKGRLWGAHKVSDENKVERKGCKVEISRKKDNQKDDSVRQSEREMKDDCGENCPEWRKGVTGSGERETGRDRQSER